MSDIYQKIKYIRYVDVYGNENIDTLYMHYNSVSDVYGFKTESQGTLLNMTFEDHNNNILHALNCLYEHKGINITEEEYNNYL